jgi:hypothetical protein
MEQPQEVEDEEHERVHERVVAIDVAKASGVVCTRVPGDGRPGRRSMHVWTVKATTPGSAPASGGSCVFEVNTRTGTPSERALMATHATPELHPWLNTPEAAKAAEKAVQIPLTMLPKLSDRVGAEALQRQALAILAECALPPQDLDVSSRAAGAHAGSMHLWPENERVKYCIREVGYALNFWARIHGAVLTFPGDSVSGKITDVTDFQLKDKETGKPMVWPSGEPEMGVRLELKPQQATGVVLWAEERSLLRAVAKAVKATGGTDIAIGDLPDRNPHRRP